MITLMSTLISSLKLWCGNQSILIFLSVIAFVRSADSDALSYPDSVHWMETLFHLGFAVAISCSYVTLIHAFDYNGVDRNDPISIKRRFVAVVVNNISGIGITYFILKRRMASPFVAMGFHLSGFMFALILPSLLTSVIYFGSLFSLCLERSLRIKSLLDLWHQSSDLIWIRNVIMAPLTEEIAFRACTATLIRQCFSPNQTMFLAPLPFALSHLHHIPDDMRKGASKNEAVLYRVFQLSYVYLFGVYATFLFVRTGHIITPILSHAICNMMGLPYFDCSHDCLSYPKRLLILVVHVVGFVVWIVLLYPITDPVLYSEQLVFSS
ncbi:hypothetical protein AB6A40_001040 [Gnathostoma spinigerum]|uniref:CAAX prenyl protease 2 n=1 Tax=Gnathostoma spinigerum TaxID=75299 RepID=A0ABD6E4J0_9BILA